MVEEGPLKKSISSKRLEESRTFQCAVLRQMGMDLFTQSWWKVEEEDMNTKDKSTCVRMHMLTTLWRMTGLHGDLHDSYTTLCNRLLHRL